jgi:hypothetical protein
MLRIASLGAGLLAACGADPEPRPEPAPGPVCDEGYASCPEGYCNDADQCVPLHAFGAACTEDRQCETERCLEGRCFECTQPSDCGPESYEVCEKNACVTDAVPLESLTEDQWYSLCSERVAYGACGDGWSRATDHAACGATIGDYRSAAVDARRRTPCELAMERGAASRLPVALELEFSPANLGAWGEELSMNTYARCKPTAADTDRGVLEGCYEAEFYRLGQRDAGPFASEVGVFVADVIHIDEGLEIRGSSPLLLVARDAIVVDGAIETVGLVGGAPVREDGYGQSAVEDEIIGGGGYCTPGGGPSAVGGEAYGSASITPLLGGGSGDSHEDVLGGQGGGAVQLVAGKRIEITQRGSIQVLGATGHNGGSGGAIVLQAPSVSIAGTLRATGGNGESPWEGGFAGEFDGGLGRIRIDSDPAQSTIAIDALIEPPLGTECAVAGTLAARGGEETWVTEEVLGCELWPGTCAARSCCAELTACQDDEVCKACADSASPGPGCDANEAYSAQRSCIELHCTGD